jgi:Fe-Mn family superoxide dismutase
MHNSSKSSRQGTDESRRRAIKAAGLLAGVSALGGAGPVMAAATKETGLSYEGLLKGMPGFQPRTLAPLPVAEIPGFLSKTQLARTYETYRAAFGKLAVAEKALQEISRDASQAQNYRAVRTQQISTANAVLLHEFYFRNLAAAKNEPSRYVRGNMKEHMGAQEVWREDFAACARVADAWAVLAYDPYDDRWHNLPLGLADAGGMVGTNPLVVCNVAKDAWSTDYRDREAYIAAFLDHIDWKEVALRYHAVDRH